MRSRLFMNNRGLAGSAVLLGTLALTAGGLVAWKRASTRRADAAAASQPEPIESVSLAVAKERQYRPTTTSVGTVLALTSITLRNELPGTVRQVTLVPGQVVAAGTVLVAFDVSVEQAELEAETAQADLAATSLARLERLREAQATSQEEVDQARAARDVALAQLARTRAIIAKKTIRAPRCRGQRGLHGSPGRRGRAAPGGAGRRVRGGRSPSADGPDRRRRCAGRSDDPQRDGAGPDPEPRRRTGRFGAGRGPGGTPDGGRLDSGERPPQGTGR